MRSGVFLVCVLLPMVVADLQYFSMSPSDVRVAEGGEAVLKCEVAEQAGQVQWSKDGLLLGFDRDIPGFERYSFEGDGSQGVHNLVVHNASHEDEGEYECQVGPEAEHSAISAKAQLVVLLPATSIEIEGFTNNSKVTVELSRKVDLRCVVKGGKPAPEIRWYRNAIKLTEDAAETSTSDSNDGRQTATSTLKLHPLPHDNGARYYCEAQRLRIEDDPQLYFQVLKTSVTLDVRFPPGRPIVEGYREGETVRMGDTLNLRCVSRGGNPLAQVIWLKDGTVIDQSYVSTDWESVNELNHVAEPSDNGALYTCKATSSVLKERYEASFSLAVLYAPSKVTIECPKEAKAGDVIGITCTAAKSNPASEVSWVVDGRPISSPNVFTLEDKGGWTTKAEITVNITQQERNQKLISCYAINQALGETVVGTATINILYAPDPPAIFGYSEGSAIRAGMLQRLTCVSHGGNPLPTIKWFKADVEVTEMQTTSNGNVISGEITVVAAHSDNGAIYRCETSSPAIAEPLTAMVTLTVHFAPSSVVIKVKPKTLKAEQKVTLVCESGSSFPAANITWWRAGDRIQSNSGSRTASANGGFITKGTLTFKAKSNDDGSTYTCQASNDAMQQSVHDAIILRVLYKPVFPHSDPVAMEVKEDETFVMNMSAMANPNNVSYVWLKNNDTILDQGPLLNLTEVKREDAGQYVCEASNDVGSSQISLILKVLYQAVITSDDITAEEETIYILAEAESNPLLNCTAVGYPLPDDVIKWKSNTFDMEKRSKTSSSMVKNSVPGRRRSQLTIFNVTKEDSGEFECVVSNGVGSSTSRKFTLLIKHPPIVIESENYAVVKSDRRVVTELRCKAEGVPELRFTWSFEGGILTGTDRLNQAEERVNHVTWESKLLIKNVAARDFGEYKCVARNEVGFDTVTVTLLADSAPDPPKVVRVQNRTHEAIQLSWIPGFDGGHNQSYNVRFRPQGSPWATYIDVHPPHATSVWIKGLEQNTTYEFAVMSRNEVGSSSYTAFILNSQTLGDPRLRIRRTGDSDNTLTREGFLRLLLSSSSFVLLFLLVLNVVLLFRYYNRKKSRRQEKSSTESDASSETSETSPSTQHSEEVTLSDYSESISQFATASDVQTATQSSFNDTMTTLSESNSASEEDEGFVTYGDKYRYRRTQYSMGSLV